MRAACLAVAAILMMCGTARANLLLNGDFSAGNTAFTTDYHFADPMYFYPGNYGILSGGDHTTGSGNYMAVDGAFAASPLWIVWQETLAVTPNTDYLFEAWARSFNAGPAITLSFNVNSSNLGTLTLDNPPGNSWQIFSGNWNAGLNTSVTLSIVNLQTNNSVAGNDFAIDDLSFTASTSSGSVPEPATVLLFGLGFAAMVGRTRRAK